MISASTHVGQVTNSVLKVTLFGGNLIDHAGCSSVISMLYAHQVKIKNLHCDVKSLTKFIGRHYCWGRVRVAPNRVCLLCEIQLTLKWCLQDPFFLVSRMLQKQRTVQKTFYLPFWDSSCVVLFLPFCLRRKDLQIVFNMFWDCHMFCFGTCKFMYLVKLY